MNPALGPVGLRRLRALLLGVFVPFAVWTVPPLLADVVRRPQANDFRLYYYAAKLGLTYGWSHLYDAGLQSRLLKDLFFQPYLNPPAMAWLGLPLSVLPFLAARVIWTVLLLVALVGAWWLLKPAGQRPQVFWLLGFLALFPAAFSIGIGQPHTLLLLALALAVRLRERGHDGWAGVVLSAFWLKPQIAFLLPVALIAARQWRMLLGLGVAGGLLGVAQVVALGPDGVRQYLAALQVASTWDLQRRFSLAGLVPSPLFLVLRVIVVGLLLAASAGGSRKHNHALVAAPLASLLVTPYSGFQDLAVLCGAAWIWLRESPSPYVRVWLLVGWVAAEFTLIWGPWPIVGYQLAWIVLLAWLGVRRWRRSAAPTPEVGVGAGREAGHREPRPAAPAGPDRSVPL